MRISTIQPLLNAGSKAMNVNGSVIPKVFSYTADGDEVVTSVNMPAEGRGCDFVRKLRGTFVSV